MSTFQRIHMKTQLLIYSGLLLLLVSIISYLTGYFGGQFTITDFLAQSDIIYEKVNKDDLTCSKSYLNYLNAYFEINSHPMFILNELYLKYQTNIQFDKNYINSNNFGGMYPIPSVIAEQTNKQVSNSVFCYAFKQSFDSTNQNEIQQVSFGDFVAPLGHIISSSFDSNNPLIYGYITEKPNLLYSYPCYYYGDTFDDYVPESRPWYKLALASSQYTLKNFNYSYNVTDPYFFGQSNSIGITLAMPLIDKSLKFQGTWCVDIFPEYIIQITELMTKNISKQMRIMILTKEGIVIKENQKDEVFPIYFQNKSLTGFDDDDWNRVQSNDSFIFKVYDHKLKIKQSITKFYLQQQQLYILFIIDYTSYTNYQNEYKVRMQDQINNLLFLNLIIMVVVFFLLQVIVLLVITFIIMKPIEDIINFFRIKNNKTLKQKYESLINNRFRYRRHFYTSPSIQRLQQTIYKLYHGIFRKKKLKDPQCEIIQKFRFPRSQRCSKIILNHPNLEDLNIKKSHLVIQEVLSLVRFDITI